MYMYALARRERGKLLLSIDLTERNNGAAQRATVVAC